MMFTVYVDDVISTSDDDGEIAQLKAKLGKEFEVKDLKLFKYFFRIEVVCETERIIISQREYVLNFLGETCMSGCKPTVSQFM
jgi:Reverse transcriptase (RNA-dependent DNA polymerase)